MSIRILSLIWDRAPYRDGTLLVLLALADWANDEGACWPSIPLLAGKARQSERNVHYILRDLEDEGLLTVVTGRGLHHTNSYQLHLEALASLPPLQGNKDALLPAQHGQEPQPPLEPTENVNLQPLQVSEFVNLQVATPKPASSDTKTCKLQLAYGDPSVDPEEIRIRSAHAREDGELAAPGGEEGSADAPCPPPAPPPPAKEAPWGKTMSPAVAPCTICDWQGYLQVWDAAGLGWQLKCCHDAARMDTACGLHGYCVERPAPQARDP